MKKTIKKLLVMFILMISYIIINLMCGNIAFAVTQTTSTDINSIDSNQYPQVKEMLQSIQSQHPNWKFKILYTDISWVDAIANEYVGHGSSPRNLVPANNSNYSGNWVCNACGSKVYDSGSWCCASEAAIAYMMDARNSINNTDIFQFLELSYSECSLESLKSMVANTFLDNDSYVNAILQAAQTHNVNAYYIIARIFQGQNTLYLQKFDVDNSDDELYWHQYMQNLLAAQKEGETLRKTFEGMGSIDGAYTFIIPVFKNMPVTASPRPSTESENTSTTTELVRVNVTGSLYLRKEPRKNAEKIGSVYKDDIITRLEKATQKVDGTYWDYVMTANGTKGYAARETYESESTYKLYLVPVESGTTDTNNGSNIIASDKVKVNTGSNVATSIPGATVQDFANLLGQEVVAKNAKGEVLVADAKLGTGCVINDIYTVSVLGDVSGDAEVDTADLLAIQKQLLKISSITGDAKIKAADINKDSKIDTADLLAIQKKLLKISEIKI